MEASSVTPGLKHYSSAIFACSVGRKPERALELLCVMRRRGIPANSTCVNAAMHGFALLQQWTRAVELLWSMEVDYGVAPDAVSYNTAMAACFRAGQHDQALALFNHMRCPTAPLGHSTHDTPSMVTVTLGTATTLPDDLRVIPSKKADGGRGLGAGRKVGTGGGGMGLGEGVRGGLGLDVGSKSGTGIGKGLGAGVGEGLMLDGKEAFGAPPPLPDTASYNTARGLKPDSFTAASLRAAGGHFLE
eukprot:jgi/Undpi1/3360/HiC_scaffold_15.g06733.m1